MGLTDKNLTDFVKLKRVQEQRELSDKNLTAFDKLKRV